METLIAFFAALLTMRLAGILASRWRSSQKPELGWWAAGLAAYALATGALAWGAAAGWDDRVFRLYYLFGALLTAPLLAVGSLRMLGSSRAAPVGLVFAGLAAGLVVAAPIDPAVAGSVIPEAQTHLELVPLRIVAILANAIATIVLVAVALRSLRRQPLATLLILAGIGVAAAGSALAGTGTAQTSAFVAAAACLLYAGFATATGAQPSLSVFADLMKGHRHGHRAEIT